MQRKSWGCEIRWEDLPPRSGVGAHGGLLRTKKRKIDYGAQQTSLGARPRLEPSPPTSPTTRLVTSPNQHAGRNYQGYRCPTWLFANVK